jgi:hypothetical protein
MCVISVLKAVPEEATIIQLNCPVKAQVYFFSRNLNNS